MSAKSNTKWRATKEVRVQSPDHRFVPEKQTERKKSKSKKDSIADHEEYSSTGSAGQDEDNLNRKIATGFGNEFPQDDVPFGMDRRISRGSYRFHDVPRNTYDYDDGPGTEDDWMAKLANHPEYQFRSKSKDYGKGTAKRHTCDYDSDEDANQRSTSRNRQSPSPSTSGRSSLGQSGILKPSQRKSPAQHSNTKDVCHYEEFDSPSCLAGRVSPCPFEKKEHSKSAIPKLSAKSHSSKDAEDMTRYEESCTYEEYNENGGKSGDRWKDNKPTRPVTPAKKSLDKKASGWKEKGAGKSTSVAGATPTNPVDKTVCVMAGKQKYTPANLRQEYEKHLHHPSDYGSTSHVEKEEFRNVDGVESLISSEEDFHEIYHVDCKK